MRHNYNKQVLKLKRQITVINKQTYASDYQMHQTTREPLDGFSLNSGLVSFTENCQTISIYIWIGQSKNLFT